MFRNFLKFVYSLQECETGERSNHNAITFFPNYFSIAKTKNYFDLET